VSEDIVTRLRYPVHAVPPLEADMHQFSEIEEKLHCQYLDCRLTMNEAANEIERLRYWIDRAMGILEHEEENANQLDEQAHIVAALAMLICAQEGRRKGHATPARAADDGRNEEDARGTAQ